jgi:hypothetical protein
MAARETTDEPATFSRDSESGRKPVSILWRAAPEWRYKNELDNGARELLQFAPEYEQKPSHDSLVGVAGR